MLALISLRDRLKEEEKEEDDGDDEEDEILRYNVYDDDIFSVLGHISSTFFRAVQSPKAYIGTRLKSYQLRLSTSPKRNVPAPVRNGFRSVLA